MAKRVKLTQQIRAAAVIGDRYLSVGECAIERKMQIAQDTKKAFSYRKDSGQWYWYDRDEADNIDAHHGPFDSFSKALHDAVEPYL